MKKILLICCLMIGANMLVSGQTTTVSKSDFTQKVSRLNTLLDQNKSDEAKMAWEDVHKMMMSSMTVIKNKMKEAADAKNNKEKEHLTDVFKNQFTIYSGLLKLREKMVENKTPIKTKLNQFGAGML